MRKSQKKCMFKSGKKFGKSKYFKDDHDGERKERQKRIIAEAMKKATRLLSPDEDPQA